MVGCMTVFVSVYRDTGQSSSDCRTYCVGGRLYSSMFLSIETRARVPVTVGRTVSVVGCMTVFVSVYRDTGQSSSDCRTYCVGGRLYSSMFLSIETRVRVPVTVGRTVSVVGCMTVFVSVYRDTGQSSSDCRTYCVGGRLYSSMFLSIETRARVPVTVRRTVSVVGYMTVFVSVYRDTGQSSSDCRTYCVDGWLYDSICFCL